MQTNESQATLPCGARVSHPKNRERVAHGVHGAGSALKKEDRENATRVTGLVGGMPRASYTICFGAEGVGELLGAEAAPCRHAQEGDRPCEGGYALGEGRDGSPGG